MAADFEEIELNEKRSEPRSPVEAFYSVEIKLVDLDLIYQFRLRNLSPKGACFLVKEGSEILQHLKVHQILDMTFYSTDKRNRSEIFRTQIEHVTGPEQGGIRGHYQVGLSLLQKVSAG
jgi:hypothetical protein